MKITYSRSVLLALGLACGTNYSAYAQGYATPSRLPQYTGIQQTAAFRRYDPQEASPPMQTEPTLASPEGDQSKLPSPAMNPEPISPFEGEVGGAWSDKGRGIGYAGNGYAGNGYADNGTCADGSCGGDLGAGACGGSFSPTSWWIGTNFLYMGRDKEDFQQLSFDDTDLVGSVLNTDTADMNWAPGFEIFAGKWFCCGAYGIEARYWGIFPSNEEQSVLASQMTGNLNTVFDLQPLNIGATNVNTLYDAAQVHRVQRSWNFQNIEVNWLQGYGYQGCGCGGLNVGLIGGVRYLRFDEGFQYASSDGSPVFGVDPANEAYYDIDVKNQLLGLQLGANATYAVGPRFRFRGTPKIGVYNNHISQMQRIYNSTGVATVGAGNPLAGQAYDINTSKDDVSFLAELDLGVDFRATCHWSFNAGYRAVGLTGVALATHQIPNHFADIPGAQDIDNDQSLILHGAYLGATYSW